MTINNLTKQIGVIVVSAAVGIAGAVISNNQIKEIVREELDNRDKNEES